jgi:TonB family protein
MFVDNKGQFFQSSGNALLRTLILWLMIPGLTSRGQAPQPPSPLVILTTHEGVDFTPYTTDLLEAVKRNWYAKMPDEAKDRPGVEGSGAKGKVSVRFKIRKNGRLDHQPTVEVSSGKKPLDDAAVAALRASAPFQHLPESFKGPYIELRIQFLYNLPLSALTP